MLVALKRNIVFDGKRYKKSDRGTEIPDQYASLLPPDAVIIRGEPEAKNAFLQAVAERKSSSKKEPAKKGDELQKLRLDNKNLLDRLAALEAQVEELVAVPPPSPAKGEKDPAEKKPEPKVEKDDKRQIKLEL